MENPETEKIYKIKKSNDNVLGLSLIIAMIGVWYVWVNYLYLYLPLLRSFSHRPIFYLFVLVMLVVLWLYYSTRLNYQIWISDGILTTKRGFLSKTKSIECTNIAMVKYHQARPLHLSMQRGRGNERMEILTSCGRYFFTCSSVSQLQEMRSFRDALVAEIHAIAQVNTDWKKDLEIDYINPLYQDAGVVKRNIRTNRQKRSLLWGLPCLAIFLFFILPKCIDYADSFILGSQYYVREDGVYYWKTKVSEADPETFVILQPFFVGKDSKNVYCRGKIVNNVDVSTFRILKSSGHLYLDKDNLYGNSPRLFSPSKELWVIKDINVDVATFEVVGEMYKDKNRLYGSELTYPYIKEIIIPSGLDLNSFKYDSRRRIYTSNNKNYKYNTGRTLIEVE